MNPRPTSTGGLTLLLSVGLALISLRAANPWLLCVACALFAPMLVSYLLRPALRSISVSLSGPERTGVGQAIDQVLRAHNEGRRSTPAFRLTHVAEGFAPISVEMPGLAPEASAELRIRRVATNRAASDRQGYWLRSTAPFGMAVYRRRLVVSARISVHPAVGPVAELSGRAAGERPDSRPARSGPELHGLREWHRGDPLGQVHWRATARHDRLTVVIPELTVQSRFALVVGGFPDEQWEALLSSAAWTVVAAVSDRRAQVRLSAVGMPDYVGDDRDLVLDWFAGLRLVPPPSPSLLRAAAEWIGPEGLLIVASTQPLPIAERITRGLVILDPAGRVSRP